MKHFLHIGFVMIINCTMTQLLNAQWVTQKVDTVNDLSHIHLTDVHFLDKDFGFVCGSYGHIYKTTNGGKTWESLDTGIKNTLMSIYVLNKDTVFTGRISLFESTNSGLSWFDAGFGQYAGSIHDIKFTDSQTGFFVKEGYIFKTTDTGISWQHKFFGNYLDCINFPSKHIGYVCGGITYDPGSFGFLYKTTNAGETWDTLFEWEGIPQITAMHFLNDTVGYIFTFYGTLHKTTDGGDTWSVINSIVDQYVILDCWFLNELDGYVTDYASNILRTTDGGQQWSNDGSGVNAALYFPDSITGYAVGKYGTVAKHSKGGPINVPTSSHSNVDNFVLHQNYPNPFNPDTKIIYTVPVNSNVTLKIFDPLGNEIKTLVNREEPGDTYSVTWNAANLHSGIYFYQLKATPINGQAEDFAQTKKMILLK
jgi:photosystem II stability/assembly factor-like uncharacterized protein